MKMLKNKGETGIGTLIVFIAMILVAAIAASVLLGTAGSLQQKSLSTGKQTQQEVSSGIHVITFTGTNGTDGKVENYELILKLAAGSDPLALNDTLITLDTKTTTQNLRFNGTYNGSEPFNVTYTSAVYNVEYLQNGSDHLNGYITPGDMMKLRFNSSIAVTQSQLLRIRVVPKHGVIVPIEVVTPDVISTERVILYP